MFSEQDLAVLLNRVEGPTLDFKAEFYNLSSEYGGASLVKDVLALANTPRIDAAVLVFGVKKFPDGSYELRGILAQPDEADIQQQFTDRVTPIPHIAYYPMTYQGLQLGALVILPQRQGGPFVPMKDVGDSLRRGELYFRRGSRNDHAWRPEDQQYIHSWFSTGHMAAEPAVGGPPAWDRFRLVLIRKLGIPSSTDELVRAFAVRFPDLTWTKAAPSTRPIAESGVSGWTLD